MSTSKPNVLILMTTYNGETYLREQIESVLAQEGVSVSLRIRDDASSDGTWAILQKYAATHPNIEVARNEPNLGCINNFMGLVYGVGRSTWQHIGADASDALPALDMPLPDLVAICDQDDVWLPNKLSVAAAALENATAGEHKAALYYAGINNVDVNGTSLGNEYLPYKVCAEHYGSLLLVQNWCLGCTTLMNAALVELLQQHPVYDFVRMYDAWIHAVALYCGGVVVSDLEHSYINRRITGTNTVGVMNEKRSPAYIAAKAFRWLLSKDEQTAAKHTGMARVLFREYASCMDEDTAQLVCDVATREESSQARARLAKRPDICMTTPLRTRWLRAMLRLNRF